MPKQDVSANKFVAARAASTEAMLEAGFSLLSEQPVGDVLSQLKSSQIAAKAGRTTGSFFNIWPTQDDYRRELLQWMAARQGTKGRDAVVAVLQPEAIDGAPELAELVRRAANANFDAIAADPFTRLYWAMWAAAAGVNDHTSPASAVDEEIKEFLREITAGSRRTLLPLYERVIDLSGRKIRPGHTLEELATVLAALVQGLVMEHALNPVPDVAPPASDENERWTLFARCALSFLLEYTESTPGTRAADANATVTAAPDDDSWREVLEEWTRELQLTTARGPSAEDASTDEETASATLAGRGGGVELKGLEAAGAHRRATWKVEAGNGHSAHLIIRLSPLDDTRDDRGGWLEASLSQSGPALWHRFALDENEDLVARVPLRPGDADSPLSLRVRWVAPRPPSAE